MEQERIWTLLSRKLVGEISPEERGELYELIKRNPDARLAEQIISARWQSTIPGSEDISEAAFIRHLQHITKKKNAQKLF